MNLKTISTVAQKLQAERDEARATVRQLSSTLAMTVARLGGEVEGRPTGRHNFLQRIDALRLMEEEVHLAHAAMRRDAVACDEARAEIAKLKATPCRGPRSRHERS